MTIARKIISLIPNTITSLNLLSGLGAIIMSFKVGTQVWGLDAQAWVYILIGAAALFDFCDGASARLLKAYSPLGKELDSLSDLVSFGVAPAMLILNVMMQHSQHPWLCYVALLIPVFGALRLAKFNIDTEQTTTFRGLPIPANAIFWIGLADWINLHGYPGTAAMCIAIVLMSLLMVARMPMFSLKFKNLDWRENFRRYVLIIAAIAFVATTGIAGLAWTIVLYIVISLFGRKQKA